MPPLDAEPCNRRGHSRHAAAPNNGASYRGSVLLWCRNNDTARMALGAQIAAQLNPWQPGLMGLSCVKQTVA